MNGPDREEFDVTRPGAVPRARPRGDSAKRCVAAYAAGAARSRDGEDAVTPEAVLHALSCEPRRKGRWGNLMLMILSLVVFVKLGLFGETLESVLIILAILFVHELGHLLGMRAFGYRDLNILFIPFFGAAATGRARNVAAYKKGIISLLGPVPGIVIGAGLFVFYVRTGHQTAFDAATMFVVINLFNLLPFLPLDGGHLMRDVLFGRNRHVETAFRVVASLALVGLGILLGAWLLAALGAFQMLRIGATARISQIADELRSEYRADEAQNFSPDPGPDEAGGNDDTIPVEWVEKILARVVAGFQKPGIGDAAALTRQVWERMHMRPPGAFATLALLGVYALFFFGPILTVVLLVLIRAVSPA